MKKKIFIVIIAVLMSTDYAKSQACTNVLKAPNPSTVNNVPVISTITGCVIVGQITDNPGGDVQVGTGNVDVSNDVEGYKIGAAQVLWHKGAATNIYVGVGAGNAATISNINNTFVGNDAGKVSTADGNTYIGFQSALSDILGKDNVFVGLKTGMNTVSSSLRSANTFVGSQSGLTNTDGYYNAFFGAYSGNKNDKGYNNTYLGYYAGYEEVNGYNNTFIGNVSGVPLGISVFNSTTLGYDALVKTKNTMVLGSNDVNVGIGLSNSTTGPIAKFHVQRDLTNAPGDVTAIYVENNDLAFNSLFTGDGYGLNLSTLGTNQNNYGGAFRAENARVNTAGTFKATAPVSLGSNVANKGIECIAWDAYNNNAIIGETMNGNLNTAGHFRTYYANITQHAVYAAAIPGDNTRYNYGVYSLAYLGANNIFNVGVYGYAPQNPPGPLPAAGTGTWAGYFNGDLGYTGAIGIPSDSSIKTNIQLFANAGSILNQINCYTYHYDSTKYGDHINLPKTNQIGFLAQEVEAAAQGYGLVINSALPPKLDSAGNVLIAAQSVKMIDYPRMIPILLEGYHEQQTIIDSLNARLTNLEAIVLSCCGANRGNNSEPGNSEKNNLQQVKLSDNSIVVLEQNNPNPFKDKTSINYNIPDDVKQAQILFYNSKGNVISTVEITEKGAGSLLVYGADLTSGVYTYTLLIDNRVVETKKDDEGEIKPTIDDCPLTIVK